MQRGVQQKSSVRKEDIDEDIDRKYDYDYMDDIPSMERQRDDNAPNLSTRFLTENVNAEQRRIVVGYLIRIGVNMILIKDINL